LLISIVTFFLLEQGFSLRLYKAYDEFDTSVLDQLASKVCGPAAPWLMGCPALLDLSALR
jgi:hypothetical protein